MSLAPVPDVDIPDALYELVDPEFLADHIPPDPAGTYSLAPCIVTGCGRVRHSGGTQLCSLHKRRWREDSPQEPLEAWVLRVDPQPALAPMDPPDHCASSRGVFVLAPLAGRVRLEVAYALQSRSEGATPGRARAHVVNDLGGRYR